MKPFWRLLFAFVLGAATTAHAGDGLRVPLGIDTQRQPEGFVTIPGAPLPAVPSGSVRDVITFYEPMVAIVRLAGDTSYTANGLRYLATLHASIENYEKAERLFDQAQTILERYPPGEILAALHNDRGLVLMQEGKHVPSLQSFRAALAILDPRQTKYLEPRVAVLGNLATAYNLLGDTEHSESAYLDALNVLRTLGKEDSDKGQIVRANLAMLYGTIGDYGAARVILEKLLSEKNVSLKLQFAARIELGYALAGLQQFSEAQHRLQEARAITNDNSAERDYVLLNLASMYGWSGDYDRMEKFAREGLKLAQQLYGEDSRIAAAGMLQLATVAISRNELENADALLARVLPILSKESGDEEICLFTTRELALVAQLRGDNARALRLSRQALDLAKKELSQILAFGSESQRLAFRQSAFPYDQLANLGDPGLLADAVLNMKGVVLDSLLAERVLVRHSKSPEDRNQLDRINALKVEIMRKIARGENVDESARLLKANETALAKRLTPQLRRTQEQLSLESVQRKLESNQVLIEIILYQRFEKGAKITPWYGGLIIPHDGEPLWVPLGASEGIDLKIRKLVDIFNHRGPGRGVVPRPRFDDASALLYELNDTLWEPLSRKLPQGTSSVLLSPDGATAFLPWSALVDKNGAFLAERQAVLQLGSVRALFNDHTLVHARTLVAFGRPSTDLPTLSEEVKDVVREAAHHGWKATKLLGVHASEGQLFAHARPGILHLATHGGLLEESVANRLTRNPMYRGFVLLEGGEETLQKWANGSPGSSSLDGVLTAEEASALDLTGTWLTVLSACETGAGDARTGEGVMGLRRGFTMAGTNHLLFTLWRVKDEPTTQFMELFYKRLFQSGDPVRAFQQTQKSELLRWKQETKNVGDAAYHAAGFVLTR